MIFVGRYEELTASTILMFSIYAKDMSELRVRPRGHHTSQTFGNKLHMSEGLADLHGILEIEPGLGSGTSSTETK